MSIEHEIEKTDIEEQDVKEGVEDKARHLNLRNEPSIYEVSDLDRLFIDIFLETEWRVPLDSDSSLHEKFSSNSRLPSLKDMDPKKFTDIAENSGTHHPKLHMSTNRVGSLVLTTRGQNQQKGASDYSNNAASGAYAKIAHRRIVLRGQEQKTSLFDAHVYGHPLLKEIRKSFSNVFGGEALDAFDKGFTTHQAKTSKSYSDFWKKIGRDKYGIGNVPLFIVPVPTAMGEVEDTRILPLPPFSLVLDAQSCKNERFNTRKEQQALKSKNKEEEDSDTIEDESPEDDIDLIYIGDWMNTEHSSKPQNTSFLMNPIRARLLVMPPPTVRPLEKSIYKILQSSNGYFPQPSGESFHDAMTAFVKGRASLETYKSSNQEDYRNKNMKDGLSRAQQWLEQEIADHIEYVLRQVKAKTSQPLDSFIPGDMVRWLGTWRPKDKTGHFAGLNKEDVKVLVISALRHLPKPDTTRILKGLES